MSLVINPILWLVLFIMAGRSPLSRFGIPVESEYALALLLLAICLVLTIIVRSTLSGRTTISISAPNSAAFWSMLLFMLWGTWSLSYSPAALGQKYLDLWLVFIVFLLPIWLLKDLRDFKRLLQYLAFFCGLLALVGVFAMLTQDISRLAVLGGGPNVFARFMFTGGCASMALAYLSRQCKRSNHLIMYSILSVICFLLIIFSGSRGAGVALIVSICAWGLFLVVNYRSNIRKGFQRVFIVISIFLAGGIVFFFDRIYQYYVSRFSYLFSDAPGGTAVEARYDLSNQAIALISNSPIWGWGIGSFGALTGENYPHNFSLEILSEMGIIGYVLLIIVIISVLSALLKIPRYVGRNDQVKSIRELEYIFVFLFISFVFFIVAVHFSGDLYDSRWLFFLWGMVIAVARIKKKILYDPDFHKGGAGN